MGAQASPSGVPYAGTEEGHEPIDIIILVVKSQPRGWRLKAVSQFLSGDGVPASGGQAAFPVLGIHRTLCYPTGLSDPARDSSPLAGPRFLSNLQ